METIPDHENELHIQIPHTKTNKMSQFHTIQSGITFYLKLK